MVSENNTKNEQRKPGMAYFIQFVNGETLIVINPVFSKEAVEQYVERKPSYKKREDFNICNWK